MGWSTDLDGFSLDLLSGNTLSPVNTFYYSLWDASLCCAHSLKDKKSDQSLPPGVTSPPPKPSHPALTVLHQSPLRDDELVWRSHLKKRPQTSNLTRCTSVKNLISRFSDRAPGSPQSAAPSSVPTLGAGPDPRMNAPLDSVFKHSSPPSSEEVGSCQGSAATGSLDSPVPSIIITSPLKDNESSEDAAHKMAAEQASKPADRSPAGPDSASRHDSGLGSLSSVRCRVINKTQSPVPPNQ